MWDLMCGLHELHRQEIVHTKLRANDVLITKEKRGLCGKLSNFASCRRLSSKNLKIEKDKDMFSVGRIFLERISGREYGDNSTSGEW